MQCLQGAAQEDCDSIFSARGLLAGDESHFFNGFIIAAGAAGSGI